VLGHEAHDAVMDAEVLAVAAAVLAEPAGKRALGDDPISGLHLGDFRTDLDHLAETVMPDRDGQKRKNLSPLRRRVPDGGLAHVQVAPIEPRPQDADQDLSLLHIGNGDFLDSHRLAQPVEPSCFHRSLHSPFLLTRPLKKARPRFAVASFEFLVSSQT
jgi:hypothetical protein